MLASVSTKLSSRMAMNKFSKMKFPMKIHITKYIPLTIWPASERIASYIIGGQLSILKI